TPSPPRPAHRPGSCVATLDGREAWGLQVQGGGGRVEQTGKSSEDRGERTPAAAPALVDRRWVAGSPRPAPPAGTGSRHAHVRLESGRPAADKAGDPSSGVTHGERTAAAVEGSTA